MYDNNQQHIEPAGHDHDDDPTPPTQPQGPRALAKLQVSEIVTLGLSNTSKNTENDHQCDHLHYGDDNDPNVNRDCPWAPLMNDYETALNTADHPLSAREIGEVLSSEHLQLGIDRLDFMTEPWGLREGAEWEFDKTTRHNNQQPGYALETTRILSGGQSIRLWYRQPAENTAPLLIVRFNPSQGGPLVTVDQALEIGQEAWENVAELVIHSETFADATILNLDIAADFAPVDDLQGVLNTLVHVRPRPRWTKKHIDSAGKRGGISVTHSTSTVGAITVYDKSAESTLDTPTIRFETKISKRARAKFGLERIDKVTDDLIRSVFDQFAGPFRDGLLSQLDFDAAKELFGDRLTMEALGFKLAEDIGLPLAVSRERSYKIRRILKTLGINTIDDLDAA